MGLFKSLSKLADLIAADTLSGFISIPSIVVSWIFLDDIILALVLGVIVHVILVSKTYRFMRAKKKERKNRSSNINWNELIHLISFVGTWAEEYEQKKKGNRNPDPEPEPEPDPEPVIPRRPEPPSLDDEPRPGFEPTYEPVDPELEEMREEWKKNKK